MFLGSFVGAKSASWRSGVCDAIRPLNFSIRPLNFQFAHSILQFAHLILQFTHSILQIDHSIDNSRTKNKPFRTVPILMINVQWLIFLSHQYGRFANRPYNRTQKTSCQYQCSMINNLSSLFTLHHIPKLICLATFFTLHSSLFTIKRVAIALLRGYDNSPIGKSHISW